MSYDPAHARTPEIGATHIPQKHGFGSRLHQPQGLAGPSRRLPQPPYRHHHALGRYRYFASCMGYDCLFRWKTGRRDPTHRPDSQYSSRLGQTSTAHSPRLASPLQYPCFWGASADKTCDRAGWEHNLLSSYAQARRLDAATLLIDLKKFYKTVFHGRSLEEALATNYPVRLLRAQCALFSGSRAVQFNQATKAPFCVTGTIIAGETSATALARMLLVRHFRAIMASVPGIFLSFFSMRLHLPAAHSTLGNYSLYTGP